MRHPQGWIGRLSNGETTRRGFLQATVGVGAVSATGGQVTGTTQAEGGEVVWTFDRPRAFHSSPTVVDGSLYVGNTGGTVYSLRVADGTEQWQTAAGDSVQSCPTVADDVAFLGSDDGSLYAFDADTGEERWQYETGGRVVSSPTVVDGTVYVGSGDDNLYAIDAGDGSEQWQFGTDGRVFSSPTVVDGTVYVGSGDDNLYAIDAGDGSERWQYETGENVFSSPTVVDGTVYAGSSDSNLYAIDAGDGSEQWRYGASGSVLSSPTVADGTVYVGDFGGYVYAIDAGDGSEQWQYETGESVFSSPTVVDGTVYVGSGDGGVYALDGGTYQPLRWQYETGDRVLSSPTVVDGAVYVGGYDGTVYALEAGVDGSSAGSRVSLGTLGHHGSWAEETTALLAASFQVTITAANAPEAGDPFDVTVELRNAGDREGTRTVEAAVEGVDSDSASVTLDAGSSATLSFSLATEPGDGGEYTLRVSTGDVTTTRTVTVVQASPTTGPTPTSSPGGGTATRDVPAGDPTASPTAAPATTTVQSSGIDTTRILQAILVLGSGGGILALLGAYAVVRWVRGDDDQPEDEESSGNVAATDHGEPGGGDPPEPTGPPSRDEESAPVTDERGGRPGAAGPNPTGAGDSRRVDRRVPTEIPKVPRLSLAYETIERETPIGSGGQADVYRATVPTADGDLTVALKEPRLADVEQAETIERLLAKEAETWQKIDDHDHIVGVVGWGNQPHPWIAMEYMDAGHLGDRAGELGFDQALWTAIATTRAVRHAHRLGVAHLDLKPQNILFRSAAEEGAWDIPKVADWGLSKQLLEHSRSIEGMSPHYAAPEQFEGSRGTADDVTDVYQLGVVFYELFTGERPFEGQPVQVMNEVLNEQPAPPSELADVPPELDRIVLTAMATDKRDRYESVLYLRDDLQALYDSV